MTNLERATALAAQLVPLRHQRTAHAETMEWDASKEAYVKFERPSMHIAAMSGWVQDRIQANARERAKNKFNPSFIKLERGQRAAWKEATGLFGYGAGGFDEKPAPADDLGELLQALIRLEELQRTEEAGRLIALAEAAPSAPSENESARESHEKGLQIALAEAEATPAAPFNNAFAALAAMKG